MISDLERYIFHWPITLTFACTDVMIKLTDGEMCTVFTVLKKWRRCNDYTHTTITYTLTHLSLFLNRGQDDHCVYLVLELLEGGDMYSHLKKASEWILIRYDWYHSCCKEKGTCWSFPNIRRRKQDMITHTVDGIGWAKLLNNTTDWIYMILYRIVRLMKWMYDFIQQVW